MRTITILSGKGGVGKSSLAASLAVLLFKEMGKGVVAADCDVDASNLALLFNARLEKKERISTNYKAFINEKARHCKEIIDVCTFSAISWNEKKSMPEINKFLCEGCGACQLLCPDGIELKRVKNAVVGEAETSYGFPIVSGQLDMGESGSGNVVEAVKERARKKAEGVNADFIVLDASAGIGCPVIASIRGSDYIIGITEPTPSGLSDLKRAFEVVNHFGIPHGIVINKHDLNKRLTKEIENFARRNKIPVLGKLPYDKRFVEAMVNLMPIVVYDETYKKLFSDIFNEIKI
jgi:MinD superfamily P-loop ATPase